MRSSSLLAVLSALAVLVAGCAGGSAQSDETTPAPASVVVGEDATGGGTIVGTVVSDELAPIQGATAGLEGIEQTAVSDAEGRFEFQNVPAGERPQEQEWRRTAIRGCLASVSVGLTPAGVAA